MKSTSGAPGRSISRPGVYLNSRRRTRPAALPATRRPTRLPTEPRRTALASPSRRDSL